MRKSYWVFLSFYLIPQILCLDSLFADGTNITPPGTEKPVFFDESPRTSVNDSIIEIETPVAKYEVYVNSNRILCWQKIDTLRHNLTVQFVEGNFLKKIQFKRRKSTQGYSILENGNIKIAFHSDGTMWSYVKSEGKEVRFISHIPQNYDKGGGILEGDFPFAPESERVVKTNWLVISDKPGSAIETDGGFGVYVRPLKGRNAAGEIAYYPYMERSSENIVTLRTDRPEYSGKGSFVVSMLPVNNRERLNDLLERRILFIYPNFYDQIKKERYYYYGFPTNEDMRAMTDPGWKPYRDDNGDGFHYWFPADSTLLPVNTVVLFEDIWTHAPELSENNVPEGISRDLLGVFIPYRTPAHYEGDKGSTEATLVDYLQRMEQHFPQMDVLVYISGLNDYCQIPVRNEDDYYRRFTGEMDRLIARYPQIDGFYIDTLPLNCGPHAPTDKPEQLLKLEPMILSYRIMRFFKQKYPDKLILLHSSENPIGPYRILGGINNFAGHRWAPPMLVQFDIYAPFIDRYADILFRGEAYPISIEHSNGKVAQHISDHIKYVVDPIGKSNLPGVLIWTHTGFPFVEAGKGDQEHYQQYFDLVFPASLRQSTLKSWYRFPAREADALINERINRLVITDMVLNNYIKAGHLLITARTQQFENPNRYDRRIVPVKPGPFDPRRENNYLYEHFSGPDKDYVRPVILGWYYSSQIRRR